ncbi:Gp49 family protein [Vibrio sp. ABG19]|uniref:Gp49 family protein n=1 Tax=Vibrio sp. ABG19 TaxID=2817385 RepID=UPI00249EE4EB|nr:Gp49 family protein [Vibrio sp. ABG19]WGY45235.1 hypothetical protein J0X00_05945 [Vibrio sp. ABG19]
MIDKQVNSVSKSHIDALIASLTFEFERIGTTTTTVCYAFLPNGFSVGRGDDACVDPANYSYEYGCESAKENAIADAINTLWMLEGYLLKVTGKTSDRYVPCSTASAGIPDHKPRPCQELKGFNVYQGKAINRIAYEIQLDDVIKPIERASDIGHPLTEGGPAISEIEIHGKKYQFAHFEPVYAGDFIAYSSQTDIYHVRQSIMQQRNYL